jgi:hypothetical protein
MAELREKGPAVKAFGAFPGVPVVFLIPVPEAIELYAVDPAQPAFLN